MKQLANILESLDAYFGNKGQSEKWIMILIVAGTAGYVAYSIFFDSALSMYNQSVLRQKSISKKIFNEKTYLKSITKKGDREYRVKQYNKEIATKKLTVIAYNKKLDTVKSNLSKLSDMLFNKKSWSLFLDSITRRADANEVQINLLANKYVANNGSFGHVLEVEIKCESEFKNIINFLNDLEQNTLVTDIYSSKTYIDENSTKIYSDVKISVWGVNH